MKIIVCTRDLDYGVGSVVKTDLEKYDLDRNITEVLVIGPKMLEGYSKKIKFRVIENKGKFFVTKEPNFAFKCNNILISEMTKDNYDKIILHFPINSGNYGIETLYRVHGLHKSIIKNYPKGFKFLIGSVFHRLYSYFDRKTMKHSDKISFVSKRTMDEAKHFYPKFKKKFVYESNTVNKKKFFKLSKWEKQKIKEGLGISDERKNILYVGRLEPLKGILNLIEALKRTKEGNFRLLVIGDGPLKDAITKVEFVKYLGKIPNNKLYKYYNIVDLFVSPSFYENGPMTVLEALQCGCNVLATDVGDAKYFLKKESIIPANNIQALKSKIKDFLK